MLIVFKDHSFSGNWNSSMGNYIENCIIPLAEKLSSEKGVKIAFYTQNKVKDYLCIKPIIKHRSGIMHIVGLIIDELQMFFYFLKNRGEVYFFGINQLQPTFILPHRSSIIMHDVMPLEFPEFWPLLHYYYRGLKYYLKRCNKIFVVSNTTKLKLEKYYSLQSDKITTVLNGVKFEPENEKFETEEYFLYVGASLPNKNLDLLVSIIKKYKGSSCFHFIGKCCDSHALVSLAKKHSSVKLLGLVSDEELKNNLRKTKSLLFPSVSEGFGLPLIEAICYRRNIIVPYIDYAIEVCGDYPVVFYHENNDLLKVIENWDSYKQDKAISKFNVIKFLNKYDWCDAVEYFYDFLSSKYK